ncbi:MAG: hypothetical protein JEZ03_10040 [Bacteroidales bacterium]|nr:hypothetical protein [Bacteroidales bacterium]
MAIDLEKYISKHRGEFDGAEPDHGHINRFEQRLAGENHPGRKFLRKYSIVYRVAAALIIVIGLGVGIRYSFDFRVVDFIEQAIVNPELPAEIFEVMTYYSDITESKFAEIERYVSSPEEVSHIKQLAHQQIQLLESNSEKLILEMNQSGYDQRLQDAILNNQRLKKDVLDNIIDQLKTREF